MPTITVNSLAIQPRCVWPVNTGSGILASRSGITSENRIPRSLMFAPAGVNLPQITASGATLSGTYTVLSDFSVSGYKPW